VSGTVLLANKIDKSVETMIYFTNIINYHYVLILECTVVW